MKCLLSLFVISCLLGSIFTLNLNMLSNNKKFKTSTLHENERLVSKNGKYFAELKTDGNFVLYLVKEEKGKESEHQIWETKTHGKGKGPFKLVMQQDGNAVLYDGSGAHIWATNTVGKGTKPYRLVMQDDGDLVIFSHDGAPTWQTHTSEPLKRESKTAFHKDEAGSIFALEKHGIDCEKHSALNFFELERDHHKIRYSFKCIYSEQHITNECHDKETPHSAVEHNDKASTDSLDHHKLTCDDGNALRSFALHHKDKKIFYKYTCCKAHLKSCSKTESKSVPVGDKSIFHLDKLEVDAHENNVFSSLHLVVKDHHYSYHNHVCALNFIH